MVTLCQKKCHGNTGAASLPNGHTPLAGLGILTHNTQSLISSEIFIKSKAREVHNVLMAEATAI